MDQLRLDLERSLVNKTIPGWMPHEELKWLGMLARCVPEGGHIMEIGSWCGRSTFAIGMNRVNGVGLTVVDTFQYTKGYRREDIRLDWLWGNHTEFDRFASTAEKCGSWYPAFLESTHLIPDMQVKVMSSRRLDKQHGVSMVFIDGDHHGDSPLNDIMLFMDDPECLIVMDDCYRHWSDVIRAVMDVRDRHGRNVWLPAGIKLGLILPRSGPMLDGIKRIINNSLEV